MPIAPTPSSSEQSRATAIRPVFRRLTVPATLGRLGALALASVLAPALAVGGIVVGGAAAHAEAGPVKAAPGDLEFVTAPTPTIAGNGANSTALVAHPGNWNPVPDEITYQWLKNGEEIEGAHQRFKLQGSTQDEHLSVRVTAKKAGYLTTSMLSSVLITDADADFPSFKRKSSVSIGGWVRIGSPVTAQVSPSSPVPDLVQYRWARDGVAIPGATDVSYTPVEADLGRRLTVTSTGIKAGYRPEMAFSSSLLVAAEDSPESDFIIIPEPAIVGTVRVGAELSVNTRAWLPEPENVSYLWLRDGNPVSWESAYRPTQADEGKKLEVWVRGTRTGYTLGTGKSIKHTVEPELAGQKVFSSTPVPLISGTARAGETLRAMVGSWMPQPEALDYQWLRNGYSIPDATSAEYIPVGADAGRQLSVRVTARKGGYSSVARESVPQTIAAGYSELPEFETAAEPTISGTVRVGETVKAISGSWIPQVDVLTYQWVRDGIDIPGATRVAHTLTDADEGTQLTVRVTGSKSGYVSASKLSPARAVLSSQPTLRDFSTAPSPSMVTPGSDAVKVGAVVTALTGTWAPEADFLEYEWERNGLPIPGANASVYEPVPADVGRQLAVWVIASKAGYRQAMRVSPSQTVVANDGGIGFESAPVPGITVVGGGSAKVNGLLTAVPGQWAPEPTAFTYQWLRGGNPIPGANQFAYSPVAADQGMQISVRVTARKSGHAPTSQTSESQVVAASDGTLQSFATAPRPTLSVAGAAGVKVGTAVTAQPGAWAPTPENFSYVWERNGVRIPGAGSATYTPVAADAGKLLSVWITASTAGYRTTMRVSAPEEVLPADPVLLEFTKAPKPVVAGAVKLGSTVLAVPGEWEPESEEPVTYQWLSNGAPIPGATAAFYTLVPADLGKELSVRVAAKRNGYVPTTRTSDEHTVDDAEPDEAPFTDAPLPTFSVTGGGAVKVGSKLGLQAAGWQPTPDLLFYQWLRDGVAIAGANGVVGSAAGDGYTPVAQDEGKTLSVRTTAVKDGYRTTSRVSAGQLVAAGDPEPLAFEAAPAPTIAVVGGGAVKPGVKLTAVLTGWKPAPESVGFQWFRAGSAIAGATAAEYILVPADAGKAVTVRVTANKPGYRETVKTSVGLQVAPTAPVVRRLTATPKPTISGSAKVGKRLTVRAGSWKPSKVTLSYQWLRNGKVIKGATKTRYTLTAKDRGKRISVRVTGKKTGYLTVAKTSSAKRIARA